MSSSIPNWYTTGDRRVNLEEQFGDLNLHEAPYGDDDFEDDPFSDLPFEEDDSAYPATQRSYLQQEPSGYEAQVSEAIGSPLSRASSRSQTAPATLTAYQQACVDRIELEIANAPQETERIKPDKDGAWIKVEGVGWHLLKWEYLYVWLMDPENTKSLPQEDIVRQTGEYLRARATPDGWHNYHLHKARQEEAANQYRETHLAAGRAVGSRTEHLAHEPSRHNSGDSGYGSLANSVALPKDEHSHSHGRSMLSMQHSVDAGQR